MTIFELVKLALDGLYREGLQEYGDKLDEKINEQLVYLSGSYIDLRSKDRKAINYSDPAARFAYVYKYVTAHGDYLVQVLELLRKETGGNVFKSDTLFLSCVGGGPGSDLIGTLKYLAEYPEEPVKKITCYLLDGEDTWDETWANIHELLVYTIAVNVSFLKLDVRDSNLLKRRRKFLEAKIFTLIYFVSEIYSVHDEVIASFWKKIFDDSDSGAIFIYIDNGHKSFDNYFDAQWKGRSDLVCILSKDKMQIMLRHSEEKEELGDYLKFKHLPKLKSDISFRILRKR